MQTLDLKPTHKPVKDYYAALGQFGQMHIDHEGAVRSAFQSLLGSCARKLDWTLVPEWKIERQKANPIFVDGALIDAFRLARGFWEAKDEHDDLEKEIKAKFARGYPKNNILFQAPERAILWQGGVRILDEDIRRDQTLVDVIKQFFGYAEPHHEEWDAAVAEFKERVPELAKAVQGLIEDERKKNKKFVESFDAFYGVCKQAINPNLSVEAVEKMLVQHLLTERIFRSIFNNPDFSRRNVIAAEIEKVIDSLSSRHFSRDQFLGGLDRFYKAIELNANAAQDYAEKQTFLNTVYERFFQGYSPKEADTHGIVYTPQPIVDFMVRSVEDILQKEFGKSLADKGVHILDPFVGTGNFIVRVMREIAAKKKSALPYKYEHELHCNEVMLLPYYVATMNIEHEYAEQVGEYQPFPGICLVDTFELAEPKQNTLSFMTEENAERVKQQKSAPIFVIVGNPPYNAWQSDENDNNRNRRYLKMDERVSETYGRDSSATLQNSLRDPYVKALRWASDRLQNEGLIAFITNNGFLDAIAADGIRKHLAKDFSKLIIVDLGGDVRLNPKLSGTTHNVFGIQLGVCISFLIKKTGEDTCIAYARTGESWRKEDKYKFLEENVTVTNLQLERLTPDARGNWLNKGISGAFDVFLELGSKTRKSIRHDASRVIFSYFSNGPKSNNDEYVYGFDTEEVTKRAARIVDEFHSERDRWVRHGRPEDLDAFLMHNRTLMKWIRKTKKVLKSDQEVGFEASRVRAALYRPFTKSVLFFDKAFNEDLYGFPRIFPTPATESENQIIIIPNVGGRTDFWACAANQICNLTFITVDANQCFPFFLYDEDGSNRRENITDWALTEFRKHYSDKKITKWDIFHYVYAVLHHPVYRERYAANLKRELPRIPYTPNFRAFAKAGAKLAELHVNYEKQPEYPLEHIENPNEKLDWHVKKMRLGKDKTSLAYNSFLTLSGIPPETYEYRLGNRSALEWVIDQYQVSTDKRSGIVNDPNREDDEEYIVRLVGQVVYVSLETVKIVKGLPELMQQTAAAT